MSKKTRRTRSAAVRCNINYSTIYAHSEEAALEVYRHRMSPRPIEKLGKVLEVRRGTFWNNHAQRDLAEWHALNAAGKTSQAATQNAWMTILEMAPCS